VEAARSSVAADSPARELSGEKATRIVAAMRASVAARGAAGSTFDHVARAAGVSRGLLHYYFGTKERLLVEVVRREIQIRHEVLDQAVAGATSPDEVIAALVGSLTDYLGDDPRLVALFFELLPLAQRNDEIAAELAELGRRTRTHLAEVLTAKHQEGVLQLRADAEAVAGFMFVLADGLVARYLCEPDLDLSSIMAPAVDAARAMLSDG
jgi:AcrR family transcriptional regulator